MRKVEVCSYSEKWPVLFLEEAEILKNIFGNEIINIFHIGSTSVPGLKAKPIIDIMPVVRNISAVDKYNQLMGDIGYVPKGENGIAGRRYFKKGGDNRSHHVHIYQIGNDQIINHLAFRDYLRTHQDEMKQYSVLKERLAQQFPYNIESYIKGKENLVREIEVKALTWYETSNITNTY